MPHWLIVVSWVSIITGFATAGIVTFDVIRHPQRMQRVTETRSETSRHRHKLGALWPRQAHADTTPIPGQTADNRIHNHTALESQYGVMSSAPLIRGNTS
ncbi:Uncharacterised protein [Afipia felis]|uniref:Uncharacterized protein n=2 Tax=Afipia felis TaxID=1035 RepID=A0A380W2Y2_AFIFE|nr:hypothetical protein AfiDRAFT_1307 [Afipia sp. 1NLS2]EKS30491.1 hypothetical protein HMPREF9697_03019 [Afipia felis ATCC 53690]SUU75236.1 Uncharacterised protein [Afipia felis]SUU83302.1 Uncharacterised protein [Afipia felis]